MNKSTIIMMIGLGMSLAFGQDIFKAKVYPEDEPGKQAYIHTNSVETRGDSIFVEHYYYKPNGNLYALDQVILVKNQPVFNSLNFYEIKEFSSFTRKNDQAVLTFKNEKKNKTVTLDLHLPVIFSPIQQDEIRKNLKELLNGESIRFYVFASEVLRLVPMRIERVFDSKYDRAGCVVFIMHPQSIFIDWFVGDVYYVVDTKNGRIMEMHGFSTLREKVDDKWEFKNMDFYYTYE